MPDLSQPRPDDGLWYARQFTTRLGVRAAASRVQARLHLPSARHIAARDRDGLWRAMGGVTREFPRAPG